MTPSGTLRIAMLSVHTCPLAALGGKETGGMNVYVRELSRELGRMGLAVDVFTRSQDPTIRRVVPLGEGARVVHLPLPHQQTMALSRGSVIIQAEECGSMRRSLFQGYDHVAPHVCTSIAS